MKKLLPVSALCGLILSCAFAANAAVMDEVRFDAENCVIEAAGNIGDAYGNRYVTVYLKEGELSDMDSDSLYTKVIEVSENGVWSDKFGYSGKSGIYTVTAVCGTESKHETKEVFSKEALDVFVSEIADKKITGNDLLDALKRYAPSLGVDMSFASNNINNGVLLARINEETNDIKTNGTDGLVRVLGNAEKECEILKNIKEAESWYTIDALIKDNAEFMNLALTDYTKHGDKKIDLCNSIKGNEYSRLSKVSDYIKNYKTTSGGGGTTGGGGGSVTGGRGNGTGVVPSQKQEQTELEPITDSDAFSDIGGVSWAAEAINGLYKEGIISGVGDGKFSPELNVKREEAAKMIANAFGFKNSKNDLSFKDCEKNDWYYEFVSALTENGIVTGRSEDIFGIGDDITRQDLAVILYRAAVKQGYTFENKKNDFADFDAIGDYAKESVEYLAGEKIISGMEDGNFAPNENATRAQTAKMIYEMMKILNEEA